jgi:hypothetical protein
VGRAAAIAQKARPNQDATSKNGAKFILIPIFLSILCCLINSNAKGDELSASLLVEHFNWSNDEFICGVRLSTTGGNVISENWNGIQIPWRGSRSGLFEEGILIRGNVPTGKDDKMRMNDWLRLATNKKHYCVEKHNVSIIGKIFLCWHSIPGITSQVIEVGNGDFEYRCTDK